MACFMRHMASIRNIVILTGAGISAESGLRTFRAEDGLWEDHRIEDVATPEAFRRDPDLVQRFYDERRANILAAQPNPAHAALAKLDAEWSGELLIVTQNIDDLHERAGARRMLHMHGEGLSAWCTACDARHPWQGTLRDKPPCPACGQAALRPDIVWFGEMPYRMDEIFAALTRADLFVSIGTSGGVSRKVSRICPQWQLPRCSAVCSLIAKSPPPRPGPARSPGRAETRRTTPSPGCARD